MRINQPFSSLCSHIPDKSGIKQELLIIVGIFTNSCLFETNSGSSFEPDACFFLSIHRLSVAYRISKRTKPLDVHLHRVSSYEWTNAGRRTAEDHIAGFKRHDR